MATVIAGLAAVIAYGGLLGLSPQGWRTVLLIQQRYGDEVDRLCAQRDLPPEFFKALIFLESSGVANPPPRFEPGVYQELLSVQAGTRGPYELVEKTTLDGTPDEAVRNLATSWGPLQIMGYHCVEIGVNVHQLRDADALGWGITWSDQTYGKLLRDGRYRDAFHMHNAGSLYPDSGPPRTHDPRYVGRGERYRRAFLLLGGG